MRRFFHSIFFLAVVLLLSGCLKTPAKTPAPTASVIDCGSLHEEATKARCTEVLKSTVNQYLYKEITGSFEKTRCAELTDEGLRQQCEITILQSGVEGQVSAADVQFFKGASTTGTAALCDSITNASYKTYCQTELKQQAVRGQLRDIVASGKRERCSELATPKDQAFCLNQFPTLEKSDAQVPASLGAPKPAK